MGGEKGRLHRPSSALTLVRNRDERARPLAQLAHTDRTAGWRGGTAQKGLWRKVSFGRTHPQKANRGESVPNPQLACLPFRLCKLDHIPCRKTRGRAEARLCGVAVSLKVRKGPSKHGSAAFTIAIYCPVSPSSSLARFLLLLPDPPGIWILPVCGGTEAELPEDPAVRSRNPSTPAQASRYIYRARAICCFFILLS